MAITEEVGSYTDYAYTGDMQSLTIPYDGIYKLECWGPGGGADGATGGYSSGYKMLKKDTVIYVCVGQSGGERFSWGSRYNGGQDGSNAANPAHWSGKHPGAGCTHMAFVSGVLADLSSERDKVLIVAGGAGASSHDFGEGTGGNGGGLTGDDAGGGTGGTQETGYAFGLGGPCITAGVQDDYGKTGGGAGWYGGYAARYGGSGGSSYIDGCQEFTYMGTTYIPETITGGGCEAQTDGKARITFVRRSLLPVHFNGTQLEKIVFNGTEITSLVVDGVKLFFERLKERFATWFTSTKTERKSRALT